MNYIEKQINEEVYPAKLSPAITRLMAAKFFERRQDYHDRRTKLQTKRNYIGATTKWVELTDLAPDVRALVERHWAAQEALAELTKALLDHGVRVGAQVNRKDLQRSASVVEIAAEKATLDAALVDLDAVWKREQHELFAIARELAHEQIKAVQAKIDPALLKRVEAIGAPALVGETDAPALVGETDAPKAIGGVA